MRRRTPLKRTGIKRGTAQLQRGSSLNRQSPRQRKRQAAWNKITRAKIEAGLGCCDAALSRCAGPLDGDHIIPTGRGGPWTEANHALRCRKHHDRKHGKPWADETAPL